MKLFIIQEWFAIARNLLVASNFEFIDQATEFEFQDSVFLFCETQLTDYSAIPTFCFSLAQFEKSELKHFEVGFSSLQFLATYFLRLSYVLARIKPRKFSSYLEFDLSCLCLCFKTFQSF